MKIVNEVIREQIHILLTEEKNIIEVVTGDDTRFFVYGSFESSYTGSSTSVDYCSFKGIEITDFLTVVRSTVNKTVYLQAFRTFIERAEAFNVKFSKNSSWFSYSY